MQKLFVKYGHFLASFALLVCASATSFGCPLSITSLCCRNQKELDKIEADSRTFIVDTSNDMYFQQGEIEREGKMRNTLENGQSVGFPKSLAWELEDMEIIKD